jgi:diguanylate cyclase
MGASNELLIPGLISAEACLVGLVVLSLVGFSILAWWDRRARSQPAVAAAASRVELATTALQLDSQAAAVLELVRTYLDAGERYSVTLAQAGKNLPTSASPDEIGIIVKFLLAENAKMQHEAGELKKSLEQSKSQIDNLRSHLAEAQEISMRDPLTSLSNRRRFDDSLARELADAREQGTSLSLVLADIDNFKKVNDLFGHTIGDEILKMFARVLRDNVCARDTVARYGGEEFAVILPETEVENARRITERMRSQLEGMQLALNDSGQEIGKITASFGIAELSLGDDADTLVQRADAKLYQAKCAGRNRVAVDQEAAA